jgi:hypothetical protein
MVDFPSAVQAPRAVSYGAPNVDFSPLSQLFDSYYNTEAKARESNIAKTFQNGLPTDANGNVDFNQAMQELAKRGAISQIPALANLGLQRQLLSAALSDGGLGQPRQGAGAPDSHDSHRARTRHAVAGWRPAQRRDIRARAPAQRCQAGEWLYRRRQWRQHGHVGRGGAYAGGTCGPCNQRALGQDEG